jgi:hypothetical protein
MEQTMTAINIELCPETGICSLMKSDTNKVDLMPFEVDDIRNASGDATKIREIVAEADQLFAAKLSDEEVIEFASSL